MPVEAIVGLQLGLYGLGWTLAAVYIKEERLVLMHWAAYALLQAYSALAAVTVMDQGLPPPPQSLVASTLGFVAAMRGVDIFTHGRATLDRWLLPPTALILASIVGATLFVATLAARQPWFAVPYGYGLGFILTASTWRLWPGLRAKAGRLATLAALAPGLLTGLLGLTSGTMHLLLPDRAMGAVQHAARTPNIVASIVVSAVFNFGYLFLFLARLIGQLRDGARYDHLTGTLNRRETEARLAAAWARHRRDGSGLALALIDVDHFKAINDQHGHARGDQMLVFAAGHLQAHTRAEASLGRWGGEEFLLVMPGAHAEAAAQAGERLREGLERAAPEETGLPLTISVGVAVANPQDASIEALLHRADQAMYQAKTLGRNRVHVDESA